MTAVLDRPRTVLDLPHQPVKVIEERRPPRLTVFTRDTWVPEQYKHLSSRMNRYAAKSKHSPLAATAMDIILSRNGLVADQRLELFKRIASAIVIESDAWLTRIGHDGVITRFGEVGRRLVTDAGVALIVDALDNTTANADVRYHGIGTGTTAAAVGDTALQTELTTEYNPNSTRATGTFSQPSANISRSVGTNAVDATVAITELGILTQAATGGGTLLDRFVFSAVNLVSGDSLQSTFSLTFTSGG